MMSKNMVKIICIIMAALMLLSACAVLLQVVAVDAEAEVASAIIPETGDGLSDYVLPAGIAGAALLAVIICLVLPKIRKNEESEKEED